MGSCTPTMFKTQAKVVLVGLDSAGKTTLLYKLKQKEQPPSAAEEIYNFEKVEVPSMLFLMWDVKGAEEYRDLWELQLDNIEALLFVVDSSDRDRTYWARAELNRMIDNDGMIGVPVIIAANKKDLPDTMTKEELKQELDLLEWWPIQEITSTTGEGLPELLSTLTTQVRESRKLRKARRK